MVASFERGRRLAVLGGLERLLQRRAAVSGRGKRGSKGGEAWDTGAEVQARAETMASRAVGVARD